MLFWCFFPQYFYHLFLKFNWCVTTINQFQFKIRTKFHQNVSLVYRIFNSDEPLTVLATSSCDDVSRNINEQYMEAEMPNGILFKTELFAQTEPCVLHSLLLTLNTDKLIVKNVVMRYVAKSWSCGSLIDPWNRECLWYPLNVLCLAVNRRDSYMVRGVIKLY